jgi:hypothetical protein
LTAESSNAHARLHHPLVPSWLEAITALDLALPGVILFLLIGVAVRAALYLHHRAGLRLPWLRQRA